MTISTFPKDLPGRTFPESKDSSAVIDTLHEIISISFHVFTLEQFITTLEQQRALYKDSDRELTNKMQSLPSENKDKLFAYITQLLRNNTEELWGKNCWEAHDNGDFRIVESSIPAEHAIVRRAAFMCLDDLKAPTK